MLGPEAQGLERAERGDRPVSPIPRSEGWSHEHKEADSSLTVSSRSPFCTLHLLMTHPRSMTAQSERGQPEQAFKGLDKRLYTTQSPFLRFQALGLGT